MCRGPAPTSVKEAGASIRLTISAGNGVAAPRDAEQLATRIGVRDFEARIWWRTGVSSSIIGRHAPGVDYLGLNVLGNTVDRLAARSSLLNTYNR